MEEIKMVDFGMNGEGVGRIDNLVYFVDKALPEEVVLIKNEKKKKNFVYADIKKILRESENRVSPVCPYYSKCGGCDLQHMSYNTMLKFKQMLVKNTLKKITNNDYVVDDTIPGDKVVGYRNKAVFQVGDKTGMFIKNSHDIIDIDYCMLANKNINIVLKVFKEFFKINNLQGYDFKTHTGNIRHLLVRSENNTTLVCLVATNENIYNLLEFYNMLKSSLENVGLFISVNNAKNSTILGKTMKHIAGVNKINFNEYGIKYSIDLFSFLQVNTFIKTKIYDEVMKIIKNKIVLDLYAGAGLLSAIISKTSKKVYSVEIVKQATDACNKLIKENNLKNIVAINGDCKEVVDNLFKNELKNNLDCVAIIDPSKKGCDEQLLNALKNCSMILYISCNPIALAKDINVLKENFSVKRVTPFDMFPNTKNVETLCVLEKI